MDDDQGLADAVQLKRYLTEVLHERALLWSLVALVQRLGRHPSPAEVDVVLTGAHEGQPWVPAQRRRPVAARGRPRPRTDDFPRQP